MEKWESFAEKSGNNYNAENAIRALKGLNDGEINVDINELNAHPLLLGVANGVVELDRDEVRLRKAHPNNLITMNTDTCWEEPSEIATNAWQDYLDTFLPDPELQRVTQIVLGHCLIGGNPEEIMVFLRGGTRTGKSTMCRALEVALGDYATAIDQYALRNDGGFNDVLSDAIHKRIVTCGEFDRNTISTALVKKITGGDTIVSRIKYSRSVQKSTVKFTMILATNEVPEISDADKAVRERLYVIPFDVRPKHINKEFKQIIENVCGSAILKWLIEGFMEYRRIGEIPVPQIIKNTTDDFSQRPIR